MYADLSQDHKLLKDVFEQGYIAFPNPQSWANK